MVTGRPDTIAAVATGGVSAIGIVRVSGPETLAILDGAFLPRDGKPLSSHPDRQLVFGSALDSEGRVVDVCLASVSRGPRSYTGEDTAEIQCHGSPVALRAVLESLFARGARQALAGEFTRRAFLNGRMDLTAAEAVIDLIEAETAAAARNAAGQLSGAIHRRAEEVYASLTAICSHYHAVIDFPDEDIPPFTLEGYRGEISRARAALARLMDTFSRGQFLEKGIETAIIGKPNVGKSSLLNALLGYDRAIVTSVPGTTRDTLSERCVLGDVTLRLTDTAGVRRSADAVEALGVERARSAASECRLCLAVLDLSRPLDAGDEEILSLAAAAPVRIAVVNKADLPPAWDPAVLTGFDAVCVLSAREGTGLEDLSASVEALFPLPEAAAGEILTNARQAEAIGRACEALTAAGDAMDAGFPPDAVLTECEAAMSALAELTGREVRADVTEGIFSRFCVGK